MPRWDAENTYSDAQAVTASAASTNVIDHGSSHGRSGGSWPWNLEARVVEDFATLTSLQVQIQQDDDSAFGSAETILETDAVAAADLVKGYKFALTKVPRITKRYTRLNYVVGGANATAGKVTAGLVFSHQTNGPT